MNRLFATFRFVAVTCIPFFRQLMFCCLFYIAFLIGFIKLSTAGVTHPVAIDSRIKTLVYSPNEIYSIVFDFNKMSIIVLENDEDVSLIAFGDPVPWSVKVLGTRIFIKALEPGVKTNMTILTNKRMYLMEISSNEFGDEFVDDQITYLVTFFYPELNVDTPKKYSVRAPNLDFALSPTGDTNGLSDQSGAKNYKYTFAGTGTMILPTKIFDDGKKTYMMFENNNQIVPGIYEVDIQGRERRLRTYLMDGYVVIDRIVYQLSLRLDDQLVCIFNEPLLRSMGDRIEYN